jgi:hypothetical protein
MVLFDSLAQKSANSNNDRNVNYDFKLYYRTYGFPTWTNLFLMLGKYGWI